MKQITIGIPAYNSHKTITDTLSSISTFVDIEQASIIIVDDASTETYNQLIQSFLPRLDIQLVRLANQSGPGVARNKVLELCQTPYITFIDSDDIFIDTFFIQQAIKELNQHISMVIYASSFLEQRGNEFNQLMSFDWIFGKVYRMSFLKMHDIKFPTRYFHGDIMEDFEFSYRAYYAQNSQIIFTNTTSYMYREQPDSLVRSGNRIAKMMSSMTYGIQIKHDLLKTIALHPSRLKQEITKDVSVYFSYIRAIEDMSENIERDKNSFLEALKNLVLFAKERIVLFDNEQEYEQYQLFIIQDNPLWQPKNLDVKDYLSIIALK